VPVLAIGYSSKAFGIAEDLSLRDFTVNAAEIKTAADLLPAAEKLFCDEEKIRGVLGEKIPGYKKETVKKEITELLKK
jgi:polysaccharide pyruvyl transferase WcaK-like protein